MAFKIKDTLVVGTKTVLNDAGQAESLQAVGTTGAFFAYDTTVTKDAIILLPINGGSNTRRLNITHAALGDTRTATFPDLSGTVVLTTGSQTIESKTINSSSLNGATALSLLDNGSNDLIIATNSTLTTDKTLTLDVNDSNRTIDLTGNLTLANNFSTAGNFALTLTSTAATNVTLPTTGTLATLAGNETLTTKTINLTNNSITGTLAEFNTALSDADFATLAGIETLTNKTLTTPTIAEIRGSTAASGTLTLRSTSDSTKATAGILMNDGILSSGTTTGTLVVSGGVGISQNLNVGGNIFTNGNLTVNGTLTTINSTTVSVDDIAIELGAVGVAGLEATLSTGTAIVTLTTGTTVGLSPGMVLTKTAGAGAFGAAATILSITNATVFVASINHATAGAVTFTAGTAPSNATANGGGIILLAGTDGNKTITWNSTSTVWESNAGFLVKTGGFTADGSATFNGNITLGNETADAITVNSSMANNTAWRTATTAGNTFHLAAYDTTVAETVHRNLVTLTAGLVPQIDIGNSAEVIAGTIAVNGYFTSLGLNGTLTLSNTTNATSKTTGALQVDGGVSIDKDIFLVGSTVYAGDVAPSSTAAGTAVAETKGFQKEITVNTLFELDTWPTATYRSAKYMLQMTQGTELQVSEILVLHNGTTTEKTEYGVLEFGVAGGGVVNTAAITTDISGANVRLLVTITDAATTPVRVNILRTLMRRYD